MLDDRDYMRGRRRPLFGPRWSLTVIIIAINVAVYVAQNIVEHANPRLVHDYLALSVDGLRHGYVWQLITFQFLHAPLTDLNAGIFHLLGNVFTIYVFGRAIEEAIGRYGFIKLYLLSGTIGGLLQMLAGFLWQERFGGAVMGASAGAMGLIAAFAMLFPNRPLFLFFLPFEIKARALLWFAIGIAVVGMVMPRGGPVAHCAHLGGVLAGALYIRFLAYTQKPLTFWRPRSRPRRRELISAGPRRPQNWQRPGNAKQEELAPHEFMEQAVNPILDKINAHGIQSLTERERQILQAARAKMSKQ